MRRNKKNNFAIFNTKNSFKFKEMTFLCSSMALYAGDVWKNILESEAQSFNYVIDGRERESWRIGSFNILFQKCCLSNKRKYCIRTKPRQQRRFGDKDNAFCKVIDYFFRLTKWSILWRTRQLFCVAQWCTFVVANGLNGLDFEVPPSKAHANRWKLW